MRAEDGIGADVAKQSALELSSRFTTGESFSFLIRQSDVYGVRTLKYTHDEVVNDRCLMARVQEIDAPSHQGTVPSI